MFSESLQENPGAFWKQAPSHPWCRPAGAKFCYEDVQSRPPSVALPALRVAVVVPWGNVLYVVPEIQGLARSEATQTPGLLLGPDSPLLAHFLPKPFHDFTFFRKQNKTKKHFTEMTEVKGEF